MSESSKCLSVMVLTEDSGKDAYDTVLALVREMFKQLDPHVRTHLIGFTPLAEPDARRAMHANLWKSTKPLDERNRRLLIRSIITELLKEQGFVLYHIDGDKPWSAHDSSENTQRFRAIMLPPIRAGLLFDLQRKQRAEDVESRVARLLLLVPFYSIEAWLYQNVREAGRLCREQGCGSCLPKLSGWESARAELDEVLQPKEVLCLRDLHNAHLASSGFPAKEVFDANASFTEAVLRLLDCEALTSALARTHEPTSQSMH